MRFDSAGRLLRLFSRAMGDRPIQEVTPEAILDFLKGGGVLTATWVLKHRVLMRSIPVRRQPGIRRQIASADNSAQTAATANALRLFDRRTASADGSDSGPAHWPQSSSPRDVPHVAFASLRNRPAYQRGAALDLAGRRPRRKGHHRPLHKVLQDASGSDRTEARRRTGRAPRTPRLASHSARESGTALRVARHSRMELSDASSRCSSTCDELPVSTAPSANHALRACTIFVTPRPCTVSSHGIAPARTSSDCFRSSLPTSEPVAKLFAMRLT